MKEITINALNGSHLQFACEDDFTIAQICEHDAVVEFFDASPEHIKDSLIEMNGADVTAFRSSLLTAQPSNGDELSFDLEGEETDDDDDDAGESQEVSGVVTVATSGGLQTTNVSIIVGRTTVSEAIFCDEVRARSGMTDAQLSNCTILLNEEPVSDAAARSRTLRSGDTITLSARAASSKGVRQ